MLISSVYTSLYLNVYLVNSTLVGLVYFTELRRNIFPVVGFMVFHTEHRYIIEFQLHNNYMVKLYNILPIA